MKIRFLLNFYFHYDCLVIEKVIEVSWNNFLPTEVKNKLMYYFIKSLNQPGMRYCYNITQFHKQHDTTAVRFTNSIRLLDQNTYCRLSVPLMSHFRPSVSSLSLKQLWWTFALFSHTSVKFTCYPKRILRVNVSSLPFHCCLNYFFS